MSPDPILIMGQRIDDPQQWNLYSYVRNNPLRFLDPTGKYTCADDDNDRPKCSSEADKRFDDELIAASHSTDLAVVHAALAYGGRNENNGVTVGFQTEAQFTEGERNPSDAQSSTDPSHSGKGKIDIRVTFVSDLNLSDDEYRQNIVHEGSHVADDMYFLKSWNTTAKGKYDRTRNITFGETETRAYTAGNIFRGYTQPGIVDPALDAYLKGRLGAEYDKPVFPNNSRFPQ
jgi:hypothetical protein